MVAIRFYETLKTAIFHNIIYQKMHNKANQKIITFNKSSS